MRQHHRPSESTSGIQKSHKVRDWRNQHSNSSHDRKHLPTPEEMYNRRTNQDRNSRNNSPIKPLRDFNNWVKKVLIHKYVPTKSVVLDLCCGKGGDLFKYHFRNVKSVVGVDIARSSLLDCIERYNGKDDMSFSLMLIHADVGKKYIGDTLPTGMMFDAVSCQFSIHYMFDTEERARMALKNASDRLKNGGKFIVTTLDYNVLVNKLKKTDGFTLKNQVFEATFHCNPDKSFPETFGNRYDFQLVDAVDKCPEFLVPPNQLIDLAKDYNMHILEHVNFHDFYKENRSIKEVPEPYMRNMSDDEWTAIGLYKTFVFEKRGDTLQESFVSPTGFKRLAESDIISVLDKV